MRPSRNGHLYHWLVGSLKGSVESDKKSAVNAGAVSYRVTADAASYRVTAHAGSNSHPSTRCTWLLLYAIRYFGWSILMTKTVCCSGGTKVCCCHIDGLTVPLLGRRLSSLHSSLSWLHLSVMSRSLISWRLMDFSCQNFSAKIAIISFLMSSCGSPVRSCWVELKYDRSLAAGGGALRYGFSESPVFLIWQVDSTSVTSYTA